MRGASLLVAAGLAAFACAPAAGQAGSPAANTEFSAQSRQQTTRTARRITVRPAPRDVRGMRRECVAEFEERWIPQWGGYVLYANRRCWWVPG